MLRLNKQKKEARVSKVKDPEPEDFNICNLFSFGWAEDGRLGCGIDSDNKDHTVLEKRNPYDTDNTDYDSPEWKEAERIRLEEIEQ